MKKLLCLLLCTPAVLLLFYGCSQDGLTSRVSEYRSAIYTAEADGASLTAFCSEREYPYAAVGVPAETGEVFEIRASLPDNTLTYTLTFEAGGKTRGGEMNYDSVKQQFIFSESDCPDEESLNFTIAAEGEGAPVYTFKAERAQGGLALSDLLNKVSESGKDELQTFSGEKFNGEIYVRFMVQGENRYYYVGFIDRSGNCLAFLTDADTGEVLATKRP